MTTSAKTTATRRLRTLTAVVGTVAAAMLACGEDPTGPVSGELLGSLISPNGAEGAAVLELSGGGIQSVTAPAGQLFSRQEGEQWRVVIVLETPGPIRLRVLVDDVATPPAATVLQVADGDNALRSTAGYRVEFAR